MKILTVIILSLVLVSCGKDNSKSSNNLPCKESRLVGKWNLDNRGSYAQVDEYCSYIEYSYDHNEYYSGVIVDHTKGNTRGVFTLNLSGELGEAVGPMRVSYTIVGNTLIYEFE